MSASPRTVLALALESGSPDEVARTAAWLRAQRRPMLAGVAERWLEQRGYEYAYDRSTMRARVPSVRQESALVDIVGDGDGMAQETAPEPGQGTQTPGYEPEVYDLDNYPPTYTPGIRAGEAPAQRAVGPTAIVHPKKGDWTGNAVWGASRTDTISNPDALGRLIQLGNIDATPGEPTERMIRAWFRATSDTPVEGQLTFLFRLILEVGVGASFDSLVVDLPFHGVQIPLPFDSCRVFVRIDNASREEPFDPAELAYAVGYNLGARGAGPSKAPTYTTPMCDLNVEPLQFDTPAHARRAYPMFSVDSVVTGVSMGFLDYAGSVVNSGIVVTEQVILQGLIVPGWARMVVLSKTPSEDECQVSVVFELGF